MKEDQVRLNNGEGSSEYPRQVRVVADDPTDAPLPLVAAGGRAWAMVWPGVGAHLRSMHRLSLEPGGSTVPLRHPMESVYYVITGDVEVHDLDTGLRQRVVAGGMALVDPGTRYTFSAGDEGSEVVGGPCPADPSLYNGRIG